MSSGEHLTGLLRARRSPGVIRGWDIVQVTFRRTGEVGEGVERDVASRCNPGEAKGRPR